MPGRVIVVDRGRRLGGRERVYVPSVLQGLWVTTRHFFRNLRAFATGRREGVAVVQYPEERVAHPDAFRGMPVLVALPGGRPRCVACGLCEFACPARCIRIEPGELPDAGIERAPRRFDIDMSRCLFCGLCEEACPEEAIVMSPLVELAGQTRDELVYTMEELLVERDLLGSRLGYLRDGYERSPVAAEAPASRDAAPSGAVP